MIINNWVLDNYNYIGIILYDERLNTQDAFSIAYKIISITNICRSMSFIKIDMGFKMCGQRITNRIKNNYLSTYDRSTI